MNRALCPNCVCTGVQPTTRALSTFGHAVSSITASISRSCRGRLHSNRTSSSPRTSRRARRPFQHNRSAHRRSTTCRQGPAGRSYGRCWIQIPSCGRPSKKSWCTHGYKASKSAICRRSRRTYTCTRRRWLRRRSRCSDHSPGGRSVAIATRPFRSVYSRLRSASSCLSELSFIIDTFL